MIVGKLWRRCGNSTNWPTFSGLPIRSPRCSTSTTRPSSSSRGAARGWSNTALVERVSRQVAAIQKHVTMLEAKVKSYLQAGKHDTAAKFALELQKAKQELAENQSQLKMHEDSYNNNVTKIKHATKKLGEVKAKIHKYDAELKMSRAEAEMAKLAESFNFNVTTDFGQIEEVIQDKIGLNRAQPHVAADLSGEGLVDIKREEAVEQAMADQALRDFEVQMGMVTPETAGITETTKELGPAEKAKVAEG